MKPTTASSKTVQRTSLLEQPQPPQLPNSIEFDITTPIGILDPKGERNNPLTGRPYQNLYTNDGNYRNKSYTELAKGWTQLSVYKRRVELLQKMHDHQIVCAKSGTGSGKTVLFPKFALHVGGYKQRVLCAIPKRLITESSAGFAAATLDVPLGREVGFKFKNSRKDGFSAKHTMLAFATTGTITTMIQNDPMLSEYSYLVIDEAHERSMEMDKLLSLVKELVRRRKDIRVLIMSATIELDDYMNFFPAPTFDCVAVDVKGNAPYHRELVWRDKPLKNGTSKDSIIQAIVDQVVFILRNCPLKNDHVLRGKIMKSLANHPSSTNKDKKVTVGTSNTNTKTTTTRTTTTTTTTAKTEPEPKTEENKSDLESVIVDGDIIAFVPTAKYADDICRSLHNLRQKEKLANFFCTKLESKSADRKVRCSDGQFMTKPNGDTVTEEDLAKDETLYHSHPDNDPKHPFTRKIVIATDVAESSVTINGATYVVDSAVAINSRFHPREQLTELEQHYVAKDAIAQRQGRVARTSPGVVYHLYTEKEYNAFDKITTPAFRNSDLSADVLGLLAMPGKDRVSDVRTFYNNMFEPPKPLFFDSACRTLRGHGALTQLRDEASGIPTPNHDTRTMLGRAMSFFRGSFTPAQAKSLVVSEFYHCSREMSHIVAMVQACSGKPFVVELMQTDSKTKQPYPVPLRFVSQYGDHLTMLHIFQQYHQEKKRHTDVNLSAAAQRQFCKRFHMKPKFFDTVEELSSRIYRTLREEVFRNADQTLLNISEESVLDAEALEQSLQKNNSPHFWKVGRRTHRQGGSFSLSSDFTAVYDVNPSGTRDLEVLYSLFPSAERNLRSILHIIARRKTNTIDKPNEHDPHLVQQTFPTPESARNALSEHISEYKTEVFASLSLEQQEKVVTALREDISHREEEHVRAQKRAADDSNITDPEAASEAVGHKHWLEKLRVFAAKAQHRLEQRRAAADAKQKRQFEQKEKHCRQQTVREVIGKRHLYPPPSDYYSPEWSNVEHRLMRAMVEGYLTQLGVRNGRSYMSTFPEIKTSANIDQNSTLTSTYWKDVHQLQKFDVVIYESLSKNMMGKVTMQTVSVLPARVRNDSVVQHMVHIVSGQKQVSKENPPLPTSTTPNTSKLLTTKKVHVNNHRPLRRHSMRRSEVIRSQLNHTTYKKKLHASKRTRSNRHNPRHQ